MLEVVRLPLKMCVQKGALCDLLGVRVHYLVLDGTRTAKHPHEVVKVIRGHRLVQTYTQLVGGGVG